MEKIIKYTSYTVVIVENFGISTFKVKMLTILMIFDIITGVLKSYFTKGGNSIRSKVFFAGLCSKLFILIIPMLIQVLAKGIDKDFSFLVNWSFNWLMIAEFYSFITNIKSIRERKNLKEYDAFTMILNTLQNYFLAFLEVTRKTLFQKNEKEEENEETDEKTPKDLQ